MRENRMLRLTWRELETWPWWNCEPTEQSKELVWKPSTYSARASSRPYLRGLEGGNTLRLPGVISTTAQSSVAVPASDARAARVVPSAAVAHETTAVPGLSSNDQ